MNRSSSLGAVPHQKPLARSRAESSHASPLEVRCACQFFQSDSLIPERVNPIGSRPASRAGEIERPIDFSKHSNILGSTVEEENLSGSVLSFGKSSVPDYYSETNASSLLLDGNLQAGPHNFSFANKVNEQLSAIAQPLSFDNRSIPSIEVESFRREIPTMNHVEIFPTSPVQSDSFRRPVMNRAESNPPPSSGMNGRYSSQKSLDRYSNSALLNKYRTKSQSQAPSRQGSTIDIMSGMRMTKTVSFDYGRPTTSRRSSTANENPNFDQYHRMSPMVFPIRDRLQKFERMHDNR